MLNTLQRPLSPKGYHGNFYDRYIVVEEYIHCETSVHINEFDNFFETLSKTYYEDGYSDTYDKNGKEWESKEAE